MSLKLSAGCTCCPTAVSCVSCSESTIQTEYDLIMAGLTDGTNCGICEDLNGSFTLTDRFEVNAASAVGLSDDGWSNNGGRAERTNDLWSQAADVPYGATSACVWNYKIPPSPYYHGVDCSWTEQLPTPPFNTAISYRFIFYGYTLAKFKISDTDYKWRLIVNYQLRLLCSDFMGGFDADYAQDGWYWEMSGTTDDCSLSTSDVWTSVTPTISLAVYCMDSETATFADFCAGTLSLTSVADG